MMPNDGPFHSVGTTCKFCRQPITVQIADSYDELSDPLKLLPLAACNHCADLRVERRKLESKIQFICKLREFGPKVPSPEKNRDTRSILETHTKAYAKLIARWHEMDGMSWDEEVVNQIMDHPENWGEVLGRLWRMFKQSELFKTKPEPVHD
jgi:hypothetical protein